MRKTVLGIATVMLWALAAQSSAAPPPGGGGGRVAGPSGGSRMAGAPGAGGRHVGVPPGGGRFAGTAVGGARGVHGYGHGYPGVRPGWYGGYRGPRGGAYYVGPGYWAGWPYAAALAYTYPYPYSYPYGYPYAYGPLVVESAPQVYIEQESLAAAPQQNPPATSYWYYCTQPAGYFPYVQNCTQPWMKVVPHVPGEQPTAPRVVP